MMERRTKERFDPVEFLHALDVGEYDGRIPTELGKLTDEELARLK